MRSFLIDPLLSRRDLCTPDVAKKKIPSPFTVPPQLFRIGITQPLIKSFMNPFFALFFHEWLDLID